jgi:hypothetical protein
MENLVKGIFEIICSMMVRVIGLDRINICPCIKCKCSCSIFIYLNIFLIFYCIQLFLSVNSIRFISTQTKIYKNNIKSIKKYYYNLTNYNNKNNNNYNNNYRNNNTNDIEIDISNLKYPIHIKYKYSFTDIKSFYQKICDNNLFPEKPAYLSDVFNEILSDKKKEIVVLDELIESSKLLNQVNNKETKEKEKEKINTNIKIPKMNPLSNMGKGFNSQKPPVNTHPSTVEENPKEE